MADERCCICLEPLSRLKAVSLPCRHRLCGGCAAQLDSCPLCRAPARAAAAHAPRGGRSWPLPPSVTQQPGDDGDGDDELDAAASAPGTPPTSLAGGSEIQLAVPRAASSSSGAGDARAASPAAAAACGLPHAAWLRRLVVPAEAADEPQQREAAAGSSITLVALHCAAGSWRAFDAAVQDSLAACGAARARVERALGSPLAACGAATLAAGALITHARLGLQLTAVAAASLAIDAARRMPPQPSQWAGALLAGQSFALALLSAGCQATGAGGCGPPLLRLLAATPRVLAAAGLLLWAQAALHALHLKARQASLLWRCWAVAATVAAVPGSLQAAVLAASAAQKAHVLLVEGPGLVAALNSLLRPAGDAAAAPLACVLCCLQALVLLAVPPAPLAGWLPQLLAAPLAWVARALLCGCCAQLALLGARCRASSTQLLEAGDAAAASAPCMPASPSPAWPSAPPLAGGACGSSSSICAPPSPDEQPACCWALQPAAAQARAGSSWCGAADGAALVLAGPRSSAGAALVAWADTPLGDLALRHAPYLVLLAAAWGGDAWIAGAAGGDDGGGGAAVRAAWRVLLQHAMAAGLCVEALLALRREATLLARALPTLWGSWASQQQHTS